MARSLSPYIRCMLLPMTTVPGLGWNMTPCLADRAMSFVLLRIALCGNGNLLQASFPLLIRVSRGMVQGGLFL